MDDLAAFLTARYDEAEAMAKDGRYVWPTDFDFALNPDRVLRDIALKRAILAEHHHVRVDYNWSARTDLDGPFGCTTCHIGNTGDLYEGGWCATVRQLGTEFAGHPDYRQEWGPQA